MTMCQITTVADSRKVEVTGLGFFDSKGREIGVGVLTYECDATEVADRCGYALYSIDPGHYFAARVFSTRDGKQFGASQTTHRFAIVDDRDAYVSKRMADSRKSAAKKV